MGNGIWLWILWYLESQGHLSSEWQLRKWLSSLLSIKGGNWNCKFKIYIKKKNKIWQRKWFLEFDTDSSILLRFAFVRFCLFIQPDEGDGTWKFKLRILLHGFEIASYQNILQLIVIVSLFGQNRYQLGGTGHMG